MPEILFEDNHLLVVNKPSGLLSQGDDTAHRTVLDVCKVYLKNKYHKPGNVYLGLVHRLDRPVSGVMVLARTSKAAGRLSAQFREKRVNKTYLAFVEGQMSGKKGTLTHHMGSGARQDGRTPVSDRPFPDSRQATLEYEIMSASASGTLLKLRPITGRRHQIRAQLSASGHPVFGDTKYGAANRNQDRSISLHAWRLEIDHPISGERMELVASPPCTEQWAGALPGKR